MPFICHKSTKSGKKTLFFDFLAKKSGKTLAYSKKSSNFVAAKD